MGRLSGGAGWILLALSVAVLPGSGAEDTRRGDLSSAGESASTSAGTPGSLKWAWLHGETVGNQHTNEAEILFSNEQPARQASKKHGFFYPGSRAGTTSWQVSDGTFWMFGGQGFDDKPTNEPRLLNDLWEFDTTKQTWSLIDDVDPANPREDTNNEQPIPRARKLAASCGVQGLIFVIFGGEDDAGNVLNDTWVYDNLASEWLILEFSAKVPIPSGRKDMAYWCSRDKLIVFGGIDSTGQTVHDMWGFSLKVLRWQQIELQQQDPLPAGRAGCLTWVAPRGLLYMYGGFTMDQSEALTVTGLVDLWQFDHYNRTWSLIDVCSRGTNTTGTSNNTVTPLGDRAPHNGNRSSGAVRDCPGARRHGAAWTEINGNLWLFGGEILPAHKVLAGQPSTTVSDVYSSLWFMADLWRFDIKQGKWAWMGMAETPGIAARYGTNYEPSSASHPGARCQMVTWTRKGQMFLYGGLGMDARNKTAFLNDVWLMTHSNASYSLKVERDWFRNIPPYTVFFVTLGSFGGVVLAFGVGFYLKKMLESPNHNPSEFRVKYSRVRQDNFYDY